MTKLFHGVDFKRRRIMFIEILTDTNHKIFININHIVEVRHKTIYLNRTRSSIISEESYDEIKAKIENASIVNNCVRMD